MKVEYLLQTFHECLKKAKSYHYEIAPIILDGTSVNSKIVRELLLLACKIATTLLLHSLNMLFAAYSEFLKSSL